MNFELNNSNTSINDFEELFDFLNHDLDLQFNTDLDNNVSNGDNLLLNDAFDSMEHNIDNNTTSVESPKPNSDNINSKPKTVDVFITNPKHYEETNDINALETKEIASTFDLRDISNLEEELYISKVLYQRPISRSLSASNSSPLSTLNKPKQNAGYSVIGNNLGHQGQYLNVKDNESDYSKTPLSAFSHNIFTNERSVSPLVNINAGNKNNSNQKKSSAYPCFDYKKIIHSENIKRMSPKKEDFDIKTKIKSKIKNGIAKIKDQSPEKDTKVINGVGTKKISKKSSMSTLNNDNKSLKEKRSTPNLRKKKSMSFDHKHFENAELSISSSLSLTNDIEDEMSLYQHYPLNLSNDRLRSSSFLSGTTTYESRTRNNSQYNQNNRDEQLSEFLLNEDEFDDVEKNGDLLDSMFKMSHIKLIKRDSNETNNEEALNNFRDLDFIENDATSAFKLARKYSFKK